MKAGQPVTITKLNKTYDRHAPDVLRDSLERIEVPRGSPRQWRCLFDLPSVEDYQRAKREKYTTTVGALVADAWGTLEDLASQMRDWYDNMPDGLRDADQGSRVGEAADTLEGLSEPDVPNDLENLPAYHPPGLKQESRADMASEAADMLEAAKDALEARAEELRGMDEKDDGTEDTTEELAQAADDLASELEQLADEVRNVEFPGMYG